jgi:methylated-DNA-[protein]-cysteine S-methyltransferase
MVMPATTFYRFQSPIGEIELQFENELLVKLHFCGSEEKPDPSWKPAVISKKTDDSIVKAVNELNQYFCGELKDFSIPLSLNGSSFQQKIWNQLKDIPFGTTSSYLQLSKRYGDVKAVRAVGLANGRNPVAIIVPCHRVIGSNGRLVGYAGGLWRKKWLLAHESAAFGNTVQMDLSF